ncbi:hypothetical protein ABZ845_28290 [Streptomyces sp. NPDC047022]|uniref:hypothetical protein n=1 Tax=Streptomyces sp. NPDC047022 TaxID=3155737 RepID=UPI00341063A9
MLESALEGEITDHVGYGEHDAAGRNSGKELVHTKFATEVWTARVPQTPRPAWCQAGQAGLCPDHADS